MSLTTATVACGATVPLGASAGPDGVNVSVCSRNASRVDLLLFDDEQATQPACVIPLDPGSHRTHHYWHARVPGLPLGQVYAYRAHDLVSYDHKHNEANGENNRDGSNDNVERTRYLAQARSVVLLALGLHGEGHGAALTGVTR